MVNQPVLRKEPDCLLAEGGKQSASRDPQLNWEQGGPSLSSLKAQHWFPSQPRATHLHLYRGAVG